MKRIFNLCGLLTLLLLIGGVDCTGRSLIIEPFDKYDVFPGDGTVTVSYWLKEDIADQYSGMFGYFILMRAEGEGDFTQVAQFGPINPSWITWAWTDSSVINDIDYRYYIHAQFAIFENPEAEGFSDTIEVTPQEGMVDPRSAAPVDFSYSFPGDADTVVLTWTAPDNHDSLYYLMYSPTGGSFSLFEDLGDGEGNYWSPGDDKHPVRLDQDSFEFICNRDGLFRYYKAYAFSDSVMSYSSEVLTIEHTWQP